MKVAIIAPPYPLEEAPAPPLGVTYVAAAFENAGAEVRIFDYIVSRYTKEKLEEELGRFSADVVGVTSVTMNFFGALRIIQDAKSIDPGVVTVMGGPHVTFDAVETLRRYPEVDIIVMGEGEETVRELVPVLDGAGDLATVRGIAFRSGEEIIVTEARELIRDLDSLPLPARHLLPISRYRALGFPVSIITSRGCPNSCIFCLGRRMVGKKVRHRSAVAVVDEIEHILSYGFPRINVADDIFTANPRKVSAVCREIRRRDIRFTWSAFSRVNTVTREMLAEMRDAGCDAVSFGIESGNPEMLKRVRKGITLEQARKAVRMCKDEGVLAHASFIVGLPGETAETLEDTRAFAESLDILYGFHFLAPFPGTTVREDIDRYDLEILTNDWDRYDANSAIVRTSALSAEDMNRFVADIEAQHRANWDASLQRYYEGTASGKEYISVEGQLRTKIIFKILSEDLVERFGTIDPIRRADDGDDAVGMFCENVAAEVGGDRDLAARTVRDLVDRGLITFRNDG
ncbi:MAG: hypothetical protein AVO39_09440 [delta proteobacterium MLS_D]|nr:MAG: hypothetical protein AVO39_09440 [delta proteobacterium MLS_D]